MAGFDYPMDTKFMTVSNGIYERLLQRVNPKNN